MESKTDKENITNQMDNIKQEFGNKEKELNG